MQSVNLHTYKYRYSLVSRFRKEIRVAYLHFFLTKRRKDLHHFFCGSSILISTFFASPNYKLVAVRNGDIYRNGDIFVWGKWVQARRTKEEKGWLHYYAFYYRYVGAQRVTICLYFSWFVCLTWIKNLIWWNSKWGIWESCELWAFVKHDIVSD